MKQFLIITIVSLVGVSSYAKDKEIMGLVATCDCSESTIDGRISLGRVTSGTKITKTERAARAVAYGQCAKEADNSLAVSITNCQYIKVVDEKVGKNIKRRVERLKDDEENNLHNDLISTL